MSEYGEMLVKEARQYGANIAILTDFDDSGLLLGCKLVGVRRFGIDIDTINEINEILDSKLVKRLIKNGRIDESKTDKINIALLQEDYKRDEKNHSQVDDDKQNHWKTLELLSKGKYKDKDDKKEHYIEALRYQDNIFSN